MNVFLRLACVVLLVAGYCLPAQASNVAKKMQMVTVDTGPQTTNIREKLESTATITDLTAIPDNGAALPDNVIGENADYYRVNKGAKGIYFIVQDFYRSGEKRTDPYLVTELDKMKNNHFDLLDYDRFPINGLLIVWFKNGLIQQKGVFNHECKRKGLWVSWYEDGQKKTSGRYQDNLKEGAWTIWYQNGRRMQKGYYQQDNKEGVWIYWHGNGKKKEAGRYNLDHRVERWSFWDAAGRLIKNKEIENPREEVGAVN